MSDRIGPTRLRILGMVIEGHLRGQVPTYGEFCRAIGTHPHAIQGHLLALRRDGLVTWIDHKHGTLRPLVSFIPAERR